jgi:hypothetical protein
MSDVRDVLDRTARSAESPPSDQTVEADVHRGRAALTRRRVTQCSVAGLIAVVVAAGAAVVAGNVGHSSHTAYTITPHGSQRHGQTNGSGAVAGAPIRLVDYAGDQLDGFVVDQVPQGWFLQGSNPYALTIAPDGDTTSPDGFEGKLVVMLLSKSVAQRLPDGDPVTVDGHDGVVSQGPPADVLTYEDGAGHFVQIQAWTSALHWTSDQLVAFAEGVHVTAAAQQGVG